MEVERPGLDVIGDADLIGNRDDDALNKLPEGEQKAWRGFWGEVDVLRKEAERARP